MVRPTLRASSGLSWSLYLTATLLFLISIAIKAQATPIQDVQKLLSDVLPAELRFALPFSSPVEDSEDLNLNEPESNSAQSSPAQTLQDLLDALTVMQDKYFSLWLAKWPTCIDWTAAVAGTHLTASLSSFSSHALNIADSARTPSPTTYDLPRTRTPSTASSATAYDDMLWVVLEWLESIKFQELHTDLHYPNQSASDAWYGTQFRDAAAHRARIFWDLAAVGWDRTLCGGGMVWNPSLIPYKNAITNELYISASIAMYLYFPGDPIDAPFMAEANALPTPLARP
ncbi:hypothetical protein N7468_005159 [Penicillium chermesinum]|uniref:Glycoside hydrolase family 76 protein n=1 Tax=Penicillium chermesinum TaxID=63820 RepID=A0A9W9NYN0_9EURO|nr:uncharacterized protein N7468_005159 [Penicillium chermesinum]KAJ5232203.1 hypothetical protein N7468_005159 [Penicillium chermesinum]